MGVVLLVTHILLFLLLPLELALGWPPTLAVEGVTAPGETAVNHIALLEEGNDRRKCPEVLRRVGDNEPVSEDDLGVEVFEAVLLDLGEVQQDVRLEGGEVHLGDLEHSLLLERVEALILPILPAPTLPSEVMDQRVLVVDAVAVLDSQVLQHEVLRHHLPVSDRLPEREVVVDLEL